MKKITEYYEAIIQLRPKEKKILDFVENQVRKREDVSISELIELKTGYDIYITSQKYAQTIARKLKQSFKGNLQITRTLHGIKRETSKKIYKITLCFRLKQ